MHALPLLLLLAAPAEPSAARRLAEVCRIYAEEAALPAHLKANLSEMKTVRDSLRDLDVEVTSHKQEVESSLTGCNGPFADDAAKAAHLAVCEPRQKALGEKGAALAARATALDARIAKCTAEAKRLSDAHKAAPPRIAELQTSLKGSGELAGTCSGEAEGRALHACWLDVWEKLQRPSPAAVTLIEAFDEVARTFTRAGREGVGLRKGPIVRSAVETNNCQDFFRAMAALRKEQGLETWADEFDDMDASAIARELSRVSKAGGGRWRSLGGYDPGVWKDAQDLASQGAIVVGAMEDTPHGHLGFVYPISKALDASQFRGKEGPFVRDGNEHVDTKVATTWGAAKASGVFKLRRTRWYVFVPSAEE